MHIHIHTCYMLYVTYIYIYVSISISLSLSLYIYIYTHTHILLMYSRKAPARLSTHFGLAPESSTGKAERIVEANRSPLEAR